MWEPHLQKIKRNQVKILGKRKINHSQWSNHAQKEPSLEKDKSDHLSERHRRSKMRLEMRRDEEWWRKSRLSFPFDLQGFVISISCGFYRVSLFLFLGWASACSSQSVCGKKLLLFGFFVQVHLPTTTKLSDRESKGTTNINCHSKLPEHLRCPLT